MEDENFSTFGKEIKKIEEKLDQGKIDHSTIDFASLQAFNQTLLVGPKKDEAQVSPNTIFFFF